jgi:hypothetical protein
VKENITSGAPSACETLYQKITRGMAQRDTETSSLERQNDNLPSLFGRLTDELTQLFDAKFDLLKTELKEEVSAYTAGVVLIIVGAVIAIVGFALLNVAIAFLISLLFAGTDWSPAAKYGLGFMIAALIYLVGGAVVVIAGKSRVAKQHIVPKRSAIELRRDKEWLKEQI